MSAGTPFHMSPAEVVLVASDPELADAIIERFLRDSGADRPTDWTRRSAQETAA